MKIFAKKRQFRGEEGGRPYKDEPERPLFVYMAEPCAEEVAMFAILI